MHEFLEGAFMPHGHCYQWRPDILALHVGSDTLIALAYFTIPLALVTFVRRRKDLAFDWIFLLFGTFIFFCGATHLFSVWTTWFPDYVSEGLLKLATAGVSVGTAVAVWPLIPKALALRSPSQLEAENQRLERRVAERTQELAEAVDALEKSNRDLRHFASFLSHELRQPLSSVRTWTECLVEGAHERLDPEQREWLERLRRGADEMAELISAELSLADAAFGEPRRERVELAEIVRAQVAELGPELEAVGGAVEVGALPAVWADAAHVRQLFRNLLENALKYRRPGVPLAVRVAGRERDRGDGVRVAEVEVADNGRGFPPEQAEELFAIFRRGEAGDVEGRGVGLAICRRVVERNGGRLVAEGEPGRGAVFRVTLPTGPGAGVSPPA